jgi:hypothetical protein
VSVRHHRTARPSMRSCNDRPRFLVMWCKGATIGPPHCGWTVRVEYQVRQVRLLLPALAALALGLFELDFQVGFASGLQLQVAASLRCQWPVRACTHAASGRARVAAAARGARDAGGNSEAPAAGGGLDIGASSHCRGLQGGYEVAGGTTICRSRLSGELR